MSNQLKMIDSTRASTPNRSFHCRTLSEPGDGVYVDHVHQSLDVSTIRASTETRASLQRSLKGDQRNMASSQDSGMYSSSSTLREIFRSARETPVG